MLLTFVQSDPMGKGVKSPPGLKLTYLIKEQGFLHNEPKIQGPNRSTSD